MSDRPQTNAEIRRECNSDLDEHGGWSTLRSESVLRLLDELMEARELLDDTLSFIGNDRRYDDEIASVRTDIEGFLRKVKQHDE